MPLAGCALKGRQQVSPGQSGWRRCYSPPAPPWVSEVSTLCLLFLCCCSHQCCWPSLRPAIRGRPVAGVAEVVGVGDSGRLMCAPSLRTDSVDSCPVISCAPKTRKVRGPRVPPRCGSVRASGRRQGGGTGSTYPDRRGRASPLVTLPAGGGGIMPGWVNNGGGAGSQHPHVQHATSSQLAA